MDTLHPPDISHIIPSHKRFRKPMHLIVIVPAGMTYEPPSHLDPTDLLYEQDSNGSTKVYYAG